MSSPASPSTGDFGCGIYPHSSRFCTNTMLSATTLWGSCGGEFKRVLWGSSTNCIVYVLYTNCILYDVYHITHTTPGFDSTPPGFDSRSMLRVSYCALATAHGRMMAHGMHWWAVGLLGNRNHPLNRGVGGGGGGKGSGGVVCLGCVHSCAYYTVHTHYTEPTTHTATHTNPHARTT